MQYRNPIIPGFYPDPSVCRVGEDYYLVNSSFEFFPGVPLYHSKDLVSWEQLGHVLSRESQIHLKGTRTSGGVYAPTIRYHNGRFYMITTNVNFNPANPENGGLGNFIVHTDDIRGEWSDPVRVSHMGIDPSLFWDDDGRCYLQGPTFGPDGRQFIGQYEIDPDTGETLSETRPIWNGTGGKCPEGPHMYKIHGTYYLMIAEGGTEWGHMETIARADNVWGPFESCPHNPIVTHRHYSPSFTPEGASATEFGCVGHADLVDDPQGNWFLVLHGVRPSQSQLHHIGRETLLAPVTWEEGWPVVNGGDFLSETMTAPGELSAPQPDWFFTEDFTAEPALPPRWAFLRGPLQAPSGLTSEGLRLAATPDDLNALGSPAFAGVRQRHLSMTAQTVLAAVPETGEAGFTVFHTAEHHYDLLLTRQAGAPVAILRKTVGDMTTETAPVPVADGPVTLTVSADPKLYRFAVNGQPVGEGRSQLLSTEAMAGTFTGVLLGVVAQRGGEALFRSFSYQP